MRNLLFLLLISLCLNAWAGETYYVRSTTDCPTNGDGTAFTCASSPGGAGAWSGVSNISYGTTASTAGRGDILYICGVHTAATSISGIGAFDGTASAATDILDIRGDVDVCGTVGTFSGVSGNAINASGTIGIYVRNIVCSGVTQNCVQNLYGTTNTCTANSGFYCTYIHDISCINSQTSQGSCVQVAASANTTFPSSTISGNPAILIENVTDNHGGGSACRVRLNVDKAIERNCVSTNGGGYVSNTWPVYLSGVFLNCGAANSGAGVTWTQVAGTQYKSTQTSCGAATGKTILDVFAPVHLATVPANLAQDGSCTGDADCATSTGQWGQVSDTIYINVGQAPTATASINLTYGVMQNSIITQGYVTDPDDAYDGIGLGIDTGCTNCTVERSYVENAPGISGIQCGSATYGCTIRSSISKNATTTGFGLGTSGSIYNVSTYGTSTAVTVRTNSGLSILAKNIGGQGITTTVSDSLGEGTLTTGTNSSSSPSFIQSNPTSPNGFRLTSGSSLRSAGTDQNIGNYLDYGGRAFAHPPSIGAWEAASGDEILNRTTRN